MQTNAAYDLERFAPREQKPRLRVAGQPKPKRGLARYNLKWIKAVAFASVFLALVCSVLYSQVQSTELSAQIRTQEDTLADLQSEYTYLAGDGNENEPFGGAGICNEYAENGKDGPLTGDVCDHRAGEQGGALGHRAGPPGGRDIADGGQLYGIPHALNQ